VQRRSTQSGALNDPTRRLVASTGMEQLHTLVSWKKLLLEARIVRRHALRVLRRNRQRCGFCITSVRIGLLRGRLVCRFSPDTFRLF
jgi:hypothetical protein